MHHLPAPVNLAKQDNQKVPDKPIDNLSNTKEFKDRIAVLTIAYHNLAVEQEF